MSLPKKSSILQWAQSVDDTNMSNMRPQAQHPLLRPINDNDTNQVPDDEAASREEHDDELPIGPWGLKGQDKWQARFDSRREIKEHTKHFKNMEEDNSRNNSGLASTPGTPFIAPLSDAPMADAFSPWTTAAPAPATVKSPGYSVITALAPSTISGKLAELDLKPQKRQRSIRGSGNPKGSKKFMPDNEFTRARAAKMQEQSEKVVESSSEGKANSYKTDILQNLDKSSGPASAAPTTTASAFTFTAKNAPKQSPGSYNTCPSPIPHPTRGKTYVDTAIQTEAEHICIGDCQCPIWTTPKPAPNPRVRKALPHVAHTQRLLALKREADARRDALLREEGIEPPKFDPNDPGKVVFYEKRAVEGGGYELVKNVWRNRRRIE